MIILGVQIARIYLLHLFCGKRSSCPFHFFHQIWNKNAKQKWGLDQEMSLDGNMIDPRSIVVLYAWEYINL